MNAMPFTENLNISFIEQNQAQKEVTANEAFLTLDAFINSGAVSLGDNTPPVSPINGDIYVVGSVPTGDWLGHSDDIAWFYDTWRFITPNEGATLWVSDEDCYYHFNGTNWENALENMSQLGVNGTADSLNRLTVNSDAALFNHNGSDAQVKVNKNSLSDTASHLFQTAFSSRAEFGLITSDDFELKVSPDGSIFYQSFTVDKDNGNIDLKDNVLSQVELKDFSTSLVTSNSGAAYDIDLQNGNVFEVTLTDNCTFTFSNPSATGRACEYTLILKQDATGSRTATWPASVNWPATIAPALTSTANATDMLSFTTTDGGATWYGVVKGLNLG